VAHDGLQVSQHLAGDQLKVVTEQVTIYDVDSLYSPQDARAQVQAKTEAGAERLAGSEVKPHPDGHKTARCAVQIQAQLKVFTLSFEMNHGDLLKWRKG